ncbi:MAG TPA: hypothetical protein VGL16_04245 [Actinomycetota bacterium]
MADPLRSPEDADRARRGPEQDASRGTPSRGTPRWVVAVATILAIALLGLIVFLHLSGAIGPGIH